VETKQTRLDLNMKEAKFRIWNITEGKHNGLWCEETRSVGEYFCKDGVFVIPESISRNHIVQFYTGLKDSSGEEIYEGDTLIYTSNNGKDYEAKVVFSPTVAAFVLDVSGRHLIDGKYGDFQHLYEGHSYKIKK